MSSRNCIAFFCIMGIATLATSVIMGQDMCIPDPLTTTAIRGHVYLEVGGKKEALSDVLMELAPYGYDRPAVKNTTTNPEGWFEMLNIRPGRYYLTAKHKAVIGLRLEVRVKPPKKHGRADEGFEFILRNDPAKACGGATVRIVSDPARN